MKNGLEIHLNTHISPPEMVCHVLELNLRLKLDWAHVQCILKLKMSHN